MVADQNRLRSLATCPELVSLTTLSLNNNELEDDLGLLLSDAASKFPALVFLSLIGNPCSPEDILAAQSVRGVSNSVEVYQYRMHVMQALPQLRFLDSKALSADDPHPFPAGGGNGGGASGGDGRVSSWWGGYSDGYGGGSGGIPASDTNGNGNGDHHGNGGGDGSSSGEQPGRLTEGLSQGELQSLISNGTGLVGSTVQSRAHASTGVMVGGNSNGGSRGNSSGGGGDALADPLFSLAEVKLHAGVISEAEYVKIMTVSVCSLHAAWCSITSLSPPKRTCFELLELPNTSKLSAAADTRNSDDLVYQTPQVHRAVSVYMDILDGT